MTNKHKSKISKLGPSSTRSSNEVSQWYTDWIELTCGLMNP